METRTQNGKTVAVFTGPEIVIPDAQSALDLIMTAKYEAGTNLLAIAKEARKMDLAKRQTWGELNPVTRKPENSKAYNRNKARNWRRDDHETNSGTFICIRILCAL